jgi:hypothetical protein
MKRKWELRQVSIDSVATWDIEGVLWSIHIESTEGAFFGRGIMTLYDVKLEWRNILGITVQIFTGNPHIQLSGFWVGAGLLFSAPPDLLAPIVMPLTYLTVVSGSK